MQQQRCKKSESFLHNVLLLAKKTPLDIFQSSDLYMEKLRDKENFHKVSKQAKGIR